jgi:hypothetical protein
MTMMEEMLFGDFLTCSVLVWFELQQILRLCSMTRQQLADREAYCMLKMNESQLHNHD